MLNDKQVKISEKLVESPIIEKERLAKEVGINNRQLEYNLKKLNEYLADYGKKRINYDSVFVSVPSDSYDFIISISGNDYLSYDNYIFNSKERIDLLFLFLISGGAIQLDDLIEVLGASKSTLYQDMVKLRKELEHHQITVSYSKASGYRLEGDEKLICLFLSQMVSNRLAEGKSKILSWYFSKIEMIDVQWVIDLINHLCHKNHIRFVETRKLKFVYILLSLLPRLYDEFNCFPSDELDAIKDDDLAERRFAQDLLDKFQINNQRCLTYVYGLTLCTTTGDVNNLQDSRVIWEANSKFVDEFVKNSGIYFDNSFKIKEQIFTHFKSMYYRLLFKFPTNNPLTEQIASNYPDIFDIVKTSLHYIFAEFGAVPNDEVAFLTIHLLTFIYTNNQENHHQRPVAAIVCHNGVASATFLYIQLSNLFSDLEFAPPLKYAEMMENIDDYDLIFTTFYAPRLFKKGIPVFIVEPILSKESSAELVQRVHQHFNSSYSSLTYPTLMKIIRDNVKDEKAIKQIGSQILNAMSANNPEEFEADDADLLSLVDVVRKSFIELDIKAENAEEAIRQAAAPLVDAGKIEQRYVGQMIKFGQENSYNNLLIAPGIALPHTSPNYGSNEIALGIARLEHEIQFGSNPNSKVRYIFTLSAIDKTSHLRVMRELMSLFDSRQFFQILDEQDVDKVVDYLFDFLD